MDTVTLIFWTVLAVFLIKKIFPHLYAHYVFRKRLNRIPGPKSVPFLGVMYMGTNMTNDERFRKFRQCCIDYNNEIFRTWIGTVGEIHVVKPEHFKNLIASTTQITKSITYKFIKPWLGFGLLTSDGEKWSQDRKLITPAFHFKVLDTFSQTMIEQVEILVRCIEKAMKKYPGKPVDIHAFAGRCALDVICETSMGVSLHLQTLDPIRSDYVEALYKVANLTVHRLFRPWLKDDWAFYMLPKGRTFLHSIKVMHNFTQEVLQKRIKARAIEKQRIKKDEVEDEFIKTKKRKAFLDLLLDMKDEDDSVFTEEELLWQTNTFLFAALDTTSVLISWAIFSLGNEPHIQQKVHEEIDQVFGDSEEPATLNELAQLKYLDRVIKETLRLYPSAPAVSRTLIDDFKMGDYDVPKGTVVTIHVYSTHRDPEQWSNPEVFDPDRFLPENSKGRHPYAYIPFSAGPRNCIGQKYAILETKIALAALLRKFSVKSTQGHKDVKMYAAFVLRPTEPVNIYFTPRKKIAA